HVAAPTFFFTEQPTTAIYPLSLHDALPICTRRSTAPRSPASSAAASSRSITPRRCSGGGRRSRSKRVCAARSSSSAPVRAADDRSEEHTSELQSRSDLVCRLLLEKKKTHAE